MAGPAQRTKAYVSEKARPEKANAAIRGAPSPWKVLKMTARDAPDKVRRLHASDLDSSAVMSDVLWR